MTQFRDDQFAQYGTPGMVYTVSERAQIIHAILMMLSSELWDIKQREATELLGQHNETQHDQ